jgi:hypothetical protein
MKKPDYDDNYPTCAATFSTLRIFGDRISPAEITRILKIKPTKAFQKGEPFSKRRLFRKTNGWFLCTEKLVKSKDTRRHIDIILKAIGRKGRAIKLLRQRGCHLDITSFFLTNGSAGGPWLMPYQMLKLGNFGIDVSWDIYFHEEDKKV